MGEAKPKPCRCCLAEGPSKDMNATYFCMNRKEIYASMLQECFNILLSKSPQNGSGICDKCVLELRAALNFRNTVLFAEQELLDSMDISKEDKKPSKKDSGMVKTEIKLEPDDGSNDSDDFFLADTVQEAKEAKVKVEFKTDPYKEETDRKTQTKNSNKNVSRKTNEMWQDNGVKHLLNKLMSSGNNELTIKKKKEIKGMPIEKIKSINIINVSPLTRIKKHKQNITTILECSNVVLFKDKLPLGYICGYCDCDSTFPDPQDLRSHKETVHKNEQYKFPTNLNMSRFTAKIDITGLQCTLCFEKLDNLNTLKEHLVKIHNKVIHTGLNDNILQFKLKKGDVYDCAMCPATYETFKTLKQHMNKHYSNYKCTKCESSFTTKQSLKAHNEVHSEGNFICNQCGKAFSSKTKLQYHEKAKHLGTRRISNCPFCNEPFRSYYQRNHHLIKVHNDEAKYKCNVCSRSFVLKTLLMYHIKKSHLMERNIQCSECGYRFFSKGALKRHMVKHTGAKKYSCDVCLKPFARKYTLTEHMRIHDNDRRFKCDLCALTFVQKCSLRSHLLSNHGIAMAASDITTNYPNSTCQESTST